MRINRLLQIIMLLINKKDLTVKYLANQFNVSKRTIYRDLETLITSGIPVCYGDNQKGQVSLLEGYSLKYAFLTNENNDRMIFDVEAIGQLETFRPEERLHDYSKAWQRFISYRSFDVSEIKQEILQSWTRCQQNGVSLYDVNMDNLVTPEETSKYVLCELPEYKEQGHQTFSFIVKNLDLDITIYDAHAQLKYIINIDSMYEKLYPEIGYFKDVSEQMLGTNSTSLALIENRPCMVVGPEHYKKPFHEFSCVAAPIYNDSELIGTVNASFVHTSITTDTLNIIYSLARLYECLILHNNDMSYHKKAEEQQVFANRMLTEAKRETFDTIWGDSRKWLSVVEIAKCLSTCDSTILIKGETGSGKKTLARCMHYDSHRRHGPCIVFDCRSIPKELMEITLFGYESTLNNHRKDEEKGLIEKATGGTLILEHIHVLSENIQKQLNKFLYSGKIRRLGGVKYRKFDVRMIVCMASGEEQIVYEPLRKEIERFQLMIPPLRERKEDIRVLSEKRVASFIEQNGYKQHDLRHIIKQLEEKPWEGNIAELFNTLDKLVVLASSADTKVDLDKIIENIVIA